MKKTPSLFKRDYDGTRLVYDEVVEGSEWVARGEGYATIKIDGTSCLVKDGQLWKRYDLKVKGKAKAKVGKEPLTADDFPPAPDGWEPAQEPDFMTGHYPGWLPVGDGAEDQYYREAWSSVVNAADGTYELIGPKVQGNPYGLETHKLSPHGVIRPYVEPPRDFAGVKHWLETHPGNEGIVWHNLDGRMVKIKRKDFGLPWPTEDAKLSPERDIRI
jgi:hypothetical protein